MSDAMRTDYFNWMIGKVWKPAGSSVTIQKEISYRKLLSFLDSVDYRYNIDKDKNRLVDGEYLRYRFLDEKGLSQDFYDQIKKPCSVLEMLVALAIRCEENIMSDEEYGDRTPQWFWGMINTLGLGWMTDERFNDDQAKTIVDRFLNQEYSKNGKGGLFYIRGTRKDVRKMEIWTQMCHYLNTFNDDLEFPFG